MNEDRRLAVLRAIVQDYVRTSEPVGSKALLERHQLGVSAATVRNDMAALEEHVVLLKLLSTLGEDVDAVAVRIGSENAHAALRSTSVVSTSYGSGSELVAGLGVLGPTRMDYPTTMASVRAVARYVSSLLS